MSEKANSILISSVDDVVTSIIELHAGDLGRYRKHGEILETVITDNIPQYHKFAVRDIGKGEVVRKYGEIIGVATRDIRKESYVHEHNLASTGTDNG